MRGWNDDGMVTKRKERVLCGITSYRLSMGHTLEESLLHSISVLLAMKYGDMFS